MRNTTTITAPALLVLALVLGGCIKPGISTPTPPQIQTANTSNMIAQSVKASADLLISARENGKLSQESFMAADAVIRVMVDTGKKINAELRSTTDPWTVQKSKVLTIVVSSGLQAAILKLLPEPKAIMQLTIAMFNEISLGVGGPTL
jgi:hypothetical protein